MTNRVRHSITREATAKRAIQPTGGENKKPSPRALIHFDAKLRGELVEMMFMVQASRRGLIVAKPYGDSRRYDFITDAGKRLRRVQVKSTAHRTGRGYCVNATSRRHSRDIYTPAEIDFLLSQLCHSYRSFAFRRKGKRSGGTCCLPGRGTASAPV